MKYMQILHHLHEGLGWKILESMGVPDPICTGIKGQSDNGFSTFSVTHHPVQSENDRAGEFLKQSLSSEKRIFSEQDHRADFHSKLLGYELSRREKGTLKSSES